MPINFNSNNIEKIVFNGVTLSKVFYNNVLVWEYYKNIIVTITGGECDGNCYIQIDNRNNYSVDYTIDVSDDVTGDMFKTKTGTILSNNVENINCDTTTHTTDAKDVLVEIAFSINGNIKQSCAEVIHVNAVEETSTAETITPDTNTQTMSLTKTKAVSSEGNFTLYQGGENK